MGEEGQNKQVFFSLSENSRRNKKTKGINRLYVCL